MKIVFTTSPTSNAYNDILNECGVVHRLVSYEYIKHTEDFCAFYSANGRWKESTRKRKAIKPTTEADNETKSERSKTRVDINR